MFILLQVVVVIEEARERHEVQMWLSIYLSKMELPSFVNLISKYANIMNGKTKAKDEYMREL